MYGREYEIRVLLPYGAHGDNANATRRWLMCENMASSTKLEAYITYCIVKRVKLSYATTVRLLRKVREVKICGF